MATPCMRSDSGLCSHVMDNPAADAPDPGPHARFPWAPALLCAASLAMAAWAWMRFSYAWERTPEDLTELVFNGKYWEDVGRTPEETPFFGRYVLLKGRMFESTGLWPERTKGNFGIVWGHDDLPAAVEIVSPVKLGPETSIAIKGRVGKLATPNAKVCVAGTGSRWHPASVAGLVVAAFGTFVFGLYLRRWVKERGGGGTV